MNGLRLSGSYYVSVGGVYHVSLWSKIKQALELGMFTQLSNNILVFHLLNYTIGLVILSCSVKHTAIMQVL